MNPDAIIKNLDIFFGNLQFASESESLHARKLATQTQITKLLLKKLGSKGKLCYVWARESSAIIVGLNLGREILMTLRTIAGAVICCAGLMQAAEAQDTSMSFFITSANPGDGAKLGGLKGADAHCTSLAEAAGVTGKTWAAYLSSSTENGRDRIGSGPWTNAKGVIVAEDIGQLHDSKANKLSKENSLSETGEVINGRGDKPNRHDILTGSDAQGMLAGKTCTDWTSNAADGSAMVGHHDRTGGGSDPTSWNAAHPSRGCSLKNLRGTGGDGLFYCFATK